MYKLIFKDYTPRINLLQEMYKKLVIKHQSKRPLDGLMHKVIILKLRIVPIEKKERKKKQTKTKFSRGGFHRAINRLISCPINQFILLESNIGDFHQFILIIPVFNIILNFKECH